MRRRLLAVAAAVAAAVTGLADCGGSGSGAATTKSALTGTVYFLIPNATTPRFLNEDAPFFKKYLHQDAPGLNVVVENANNDAATQQSQVEDAITKGAAAIVLIVVDPFQAAGELRDAAAAHIPVIAYDHNAQNGPLAAYDVYNSVQIGQFQAAPACKFLGSGSGTKTLARIMGNAGEYGTTRYYAGQNQCLSPLVKSG
jgi:D-xylose transport system substrate-binding protein